VLEGINLWFLLVAEVDHYKKRMSCIFISESVLIPYLLGDRGVALHIHRVVALQLAIVITLLAALRGPKMAGGPQRLAIRARAAQTEESLAIHVEGEILIDLCRCDGCDDIRRDSLLSLLHLLLLWLGSR